jgi:hypothetical protein
MHRTCSLRASIRKFSFPFSHNWPVTCETSRPCFSKACSTSVALCEKLLSYINLDQMTLTFHHAITGRQSPRNNRPHRPRRGTCTIRLPECRQTTISQAVNHGLSQEQFAKRPAHLTEGQARGPQTQRQLVPMVLRTPVQYSQLEHKHLQAQQQVLTQVQRSPTRMQSGTLR